MTLRRLTKRDVTVQILASEEDFHYTDNAYYAPELVQSFNRMVEDYGLWGWCCVEVKVTWKGFSGSAFLGGCSYRDQEDFIDHSGYYSTMISEALEELNQTVQKAYMNIRDLAV